MIDRRQLLEDLKPLLRAMEEDLRARCDEVPDIDRTLQAEYQKAFSAGRTGMAYEQWRADLITQVGAAWVLSCVFVRFLEDNALTEAAMISGPLHEASEGAGLMRARDERDLYFRNHPTDSDRDYLLYVFRKLADLPATAELFGKHNPLNEYPGWLSGDAAQELIEFFQRIDADGTGEIVHDFTDDAWDTRFLGDLYQDLSETARKKYALLQTPDFVEEFILERTLEPAIQEFGLKDFKMIDPACGSGHFLLGAFTRILNHWRRVEPGTGERELINRALSSVHGVDINPYAVAIARFRLLLAAMRELGVTRLKDTPNFRSNLACGDSLLHGSENGEQQVMEFHPLAHHYQSEDIEALKWILKPGQYHVVVGNPPYITVKDRASNQAYRSIYGSCYKEYSLVCPFFQRMHQLAVHSYHRVNGSIGYVGQITAASFMTREFGKRLVEKYIPGWDITHIIDSDKAQLPGHATPTVIVVSRNRSPVANTVRVVMGIKKQIPAPPDPEKGAVWQSILHQIDMPGSESDWVTVKDLPRKIMGRHPWSLGGGGAAELKGELDGKREMPLSDVIADSGARLLTRLDDVFQFPPRTLSRRGLTHQERRGLVVGKDVRDWKFQSTNEICFPYDSEYLPIPHMRLILFLWAWRVNLSQRITFGKTQLEHGKAWSEYSMFFTGRFQPNALVFSDVSTHNHFVLDEGTKLTNSHAPVIILALPSGLSVTGCLGVLNSSTACFWMKQVCHDKGAGGIGGGIASERWEHRFEYDLSKLKKYPIPKKLQSDYAERIHAVASQLPSATEVLTDWTNGTRKEIVNGLVYAKMQYKNIFNQIVAWQEELDWRVYESYKLATSDIRYTDEPPSIQLGQRAFEIVLARRMEAGEEETTWFERHNSIPITEIPTEWPEDYKQVVQRRIELIESDRNIGLIERPEYKRRWNIEPWEQRQEKALWNWMLDRLEGYFDLNGRMNEESKVTAHNSLRQPRLTSIAKVADISRADNDFMQVAELYRGRPDFDVAALVAELIDSESIPHLPVLRYKPSGLEKRAVWERTWQLQRLEDDIASLFKIESLRAINPDQVHKSLQPAVQNLALEEDKKSLILADLVTAAKSLARMIAEGRTLDSEIVTKPITDAAERARAKAIGDIPVPPKYAKKDFLSNTYWGLRGKLDVPKERWVSFPHCEGEDGSLVIAWAGYDHVQLAQAVAERFENARQYEGRTLVPLLTSIGQLIPWLKQWHNEIDSTYGTRLGDFFEGYLTTEAKALNMTVTEVMAWTPPVNTKKTRKRRKRTTQKT